MAQLHGSLDDTQYYALYKTAQGSQVYLTAASADGYIKMDTEDAEVTQFLMSEHEAIISIEDGIVRLVWFDYNRQKMFTLCANNVSESFLIALGEEFVKLLR